MTKRASGKYARKPRDFYATPAAAVEPLRLHLPGQFKFVEPCAGDGRLVKHLEAIGGECFGAWDIDKEHEAEVDFCSDALDVLDHIYQRADFIITNPPWSRPVLHDMIARFPSLRPTWLLFDSDWVHTRQAAPFLPRLRKIVSVGRVKWIEDSNSVGFDNCAWHLFGSDTSEVSCTFFGRRAA